MTPRYDMEILRQRCDETLAQIAACRKHGAAPWLAWRYNRLEREVREFRDVVWPHNERRCKMKEYDPSDQNKGDK